MKKSKTQNQFLAELAKIPIVQVACEKTNLSRNTVYRWRKEDLTFSTKMDEALKEGEDLVNDISESQLLTMIKDKEWSAISFWLRHRNPKYKERMEITTKIEDTSLTPEQELIIRQALKLAGGVPLEINNEDKTNETNTTNDSARISGNNA